MEDYDGALLQLVDKVVIEPIEDINVRPLSQLFEQELLLSKSSWN